LIAEVAKQIENEMQNGKKYEDAANVVMVELLRVAK
jgi:hypothetical protein